MSFQKYSPASWSRRGWIAAFVAPLALSLALTACAPAEPEPTLEDAGKAYVTYAMTEKGASPSVANRTCEIAYEELGDEKIIEYWSGQ
ncbi:hypothetical protein [Microbacterium sp.]|uniref:hypothetical protein n=1 Tax=Microbacterium sp. TaxID=51671 RepID=UPI003566C640